MLEGIKSAFEGLWTSFVRTFIPVVVGSVVTFLSNAGLPVDAEFSLALSSLLGALAAGLFYLAVRVVEKYLPKVGLLLGSTKQPVYTTPENAPVLQDIVNRVDG